MLLSPLASKLPIFRSSKWTISLFVSLQCFEGTQEIPLHSETQNLHSDGLKQKWSKEQRTEQGGPTGYSLLILGAPGKKQKFHLASTLPHKSHRGAAEDTRCWIENCSVQEVSWTLQESRGGTQTFNADKEKRKGNCHLSSYNPPLKTPCFLYMFHLIHCYCVFSNY